MKLEIDARAANPTDTLFVGTFLHASHLAFADAIEADICYLFGRDFEDWERLASGTVSRLAGYLRRSLSLPTGYDHYLLEGGTTLIPARGFRFRERDADFVLLNADETFINMAEGLGHYGRLDASVHRQSARVLSGAMSVGELSDAYLRRCGFHFPSEVVYPGIDPELYDRLGRVSPDIGSARIVVLAYGANHPRRTGGSSTGLDLLVEAMDEIRRAHPAAELHIGGIGHPEEWDAVGGVHLHGWIEDPVSFFERGELSCHPGRGECFPVSVLEPMRAGCPCIMSDRVGAKELIPGLEDVLVCEPTRESVAEYVIEYLDSSKDERARYASSVRDAVEGFRRDIVAAEFANRYERLLGRI